MFGIFNVRGLTLDGESKEIFAKLDVSLRDHVYLFSNERNCNALAVWIKIGLHADGEGWAFPGRRNIQKSTGISSDAAIRAALKHLCAMRIDGHRVFAMWRSMNPTTRQWGASLYRIFPDARGGGGMETVPDKFKGLELVPWYDNPLVDDPPIDNLSVDNLSMGNPSVGNLSIGNRPQKKSQGEVDPSGGRSMLEEETMEKFSTAEPSENVSSSDRQSMDGDPLPDTVTAHDPVTAGERSEHDGGDPGGVPGTSYNTDSDGGEWADVLAAFCEVTGVKVDVLTEERRAKHLSSLRARARECNVKPGVLAHVIRQWPTSALSWRTWTDPASGIVKEDLAKLCEQHLSGGIKKAGGRGERNREIVREWLLPTGAVIDGDGGAWVSVDGVEIQQAAEVGR